MATLGSFGSQNSPTVMGFAFFNKNSIVDKTMISFSMWKTTIKIAIYPLIESGDMSDDQVKYDKKNGQAIYLTPYKAYMFAGLLKEFLKNPAEIYGKGVPSGQNLITIEDPNDTNGLNKPGACPCIVVRKINGETGAVEASYAYEFNPNPYIVIESYDQKTAKFVKSVERFKELEPNLIIMQLEAYCQAMTNATAFTVADTLFPSLEKMAAKLGVDLNSNPYGSSYKSNSYFASNTGMPAQQDPQPTQGIGLGAMM